VLKNPAAFNDDFWDRFVTVWIAAAVAGLSVATFVAIDCRVTRLGQFFAMVYFGQSDQKGRIFTQWAIVFFG
jgi:hypothetical protein